MKLWDAPGTIVQEKDFADLFPGKAAREAYAQRVGEEGVSLLNALQAPETTRG